MVRSCHGNCLLVTAAQLSCSSGYSVAHARSPAARPFPGRRCEVRIDAVKVAHGPRRSGSARSAGPRRVRFRWRVARQRSRLVRHRTPCNGGRRRPPPRSAPLVCTTLRACRGVSTAARPPSHACRHAELLCALPGCGREGCDIAVPVEVGAPVTGAAPGCCCK